MVLERTPKPSKIKAQKVQAVEVVHEKAVVVEKQSANFFAVLAEGADESP
jgi:hypothetical protein